MRFTTIAAAAAFLGMVVANPVNIVYETEIITITSCAPEKPNCPYATSTSTVAPPPAEETPCTDEDELPEPSVEIPPHFPNTTSTYTFVPSGEPTRTYVPTGTGGLPTGTGTGSPIPPAQNTTIPQVPDIPPPSEGAASKMGASFIAIIGAAALAVLA